MTNTIDYCAYHTHHVELFLRMANDMTDCIKPSPHIQYLSIPIHRVIKDHPAASQRDATGWGPESALECVMQ